MGIADRVEGTVENWRQKWGEALKGFLVYILSFGLEVFMDILGKAFAPKLKPLIDTLEATGEVPPEMQKILDELKEPTGEVAAMFANTAGGALIGGALGKIMDTIFNPLGYSASNLKRNALLTEAHYIALWLRKQLPPEGLNTYLHMLNLSDTQIDILKTLTSIRLDPLSVITAWRRDKGKYGALLDDLRHQGWSDDRIEALKFVTQFFPGPADLVTWQAKEVFEPDAIARYGLGDEFEKLDLTLFEKAGVSKEQARNYWIAHWEHASWTQVMEMLHRGLVTEPEVWDWFRLVEIPPFWRQKLIDTAYTWPTRVDVRRFWDMRTIDEARLKELYEGMGYRGKNLEDYIKWTKVYTDFPYWLSRWQKGWVTEEDVRKWLRSVGIPEERINIFIQDKIKPESPAKVEEGKALTKTEIYKGVKQGKITREEGIELLMDLNYNRAEAEYLLDINVAVATGSPENYTEFKDLTTAYKLAVGRESKPMPEELKAAAAEVIRLTGEVKSLQDSIDKEQKSLLEIEPIPEEATARLTELQVSRNRTIAELERVKSVYTRLLAEWKHKIS